MTPLNDEIIIAVGQLVDDAQSERRDPSHSDLKFYIERHGLTGADPNSRGQTLGKAKRIRATLSWALEHEPEAGGALVASLVKVIRAHGGFRGSCPNYVGGHAVKNAMAAFDSEGYELSASGELRPKLLDTLSGPKLTEALEAYVRRAKIGAQDAALVTGTGKDLLEAVAGHVLFRVYGSYSSRSNFPTLLGQAFNAIGLATPQDAVEPHETPMRGVERQMYELGCKVNGLRNKEGTGHGRPWLPQVTPAESKVAIELMGIVAEYLLSRCPS